MFTECPVGGGLTGVDFEDDVALPVFHGHMRFAPVRLWDGHDGAAGELLFAYRFPDSGRMPDRDVEGRFPVCPVQAFTVFSSTQRLAPLWLL